MNKLIGALLLGVTTLSWGCSQAQGPLEAEDAAPAGAAALSEDDKVVYAMGAILAKNNVVPLHLSDAELSVFLDGIEAGAKGDAVDVSLADYTDRINEFLQARAQQSAAEEKQRSIAYLEQAAAESGAVLSNSGLVYRTIQAGDGPSPSSEDTVTVHYHGTFPDGEVFDSSRDRGEPVEFPLKQVIPCWTEGVQRMKVGETAKLVCPSDIAYGDAGRPGIPGGATLIFEVELLGIKGK